MFSIINLTQHASLQVFHFRELVKEKETLDPNQEYPKQGYKKRSEPIKHNSKGFFVQLHISNMSSNIKTI